MPSRRRQRQKRRAKGPGAFRTRSGAFPSTESVIRCVRCKMPGYIDRSGRPMIRHTPDCEGEDE